MEHAALEWSTPRTRNVKARGTRSRSHTRPGRLRLIAGPPDVCRSCGGACEQRGLTCLTCAGTGLAAA